MAVDTQIDQQTHRSAYDDTQLREELTRLKESNQAMQNHIQMMQWQSQSPKKETPQSFNPFQGKDPNDSIRVEEAAKSFQEFENRINANLQSQLSEIRLASQAKDYQGVINQYLPQALKEDPSLRDTLQRSNDPMTTAYLASRGSKAYVQDQLASQLPQKQQEKPKPNPEADKIINNLQASGSLASVSNAATAAGDIPATSRMSDAEFRQYKSGLKFKVAARNLG